MIKEELSYMLTVFFVHKNRWSWAGEYAVSTEWWHAAPSSWKLFHEPLGCFEMNASRPSKNMKIHWLNCARICLWTYLKSGVFTTHPASLSWCQICVAILLTNCLIYFAVRAGSTIKFKMSWKFASCTVRGRSHNIEQIQSLFTEYEIFYKNPLWEHCSTNSGE